MTAYLLSKICIESGLPEGILNIVHGTGERTGDPLTTHPDTPIVSFTGGTATGKHIASVTAPMFKKISLELGGKNPNIIFSDSDFDKAVSFASASMFTNQGQICYVDLEFLFKKIFTKNSKKRLFQKLQNLKLETQKIPIQIWER